MSNDFDNEKIKARLIVNRLFAFINIRTIALFIIVSLPVITLFRVFVLKA